LPLVMTSWLLLFLLLFMLLLFFFCLNSTTILSFQTRPNAECDKILSNGNHLKAKFLYIDNNNCAVIFCNILPTVKDTEAQELINVYNSAIYKGINTNDSSSTQQIEKNSNSISKSITNETSSETTTIEEATTTTEITTAKPITTTEATTISASKSGNSAKEVKIPTNTSVVDSNRNGNSNTNNSSPSNNTDSTIGANNFDEQTVYIGRTGNKYHRKSCSTLKGNGTAISLSEARSQGRTPCKRCKP